jgi:hypothetical protein
MRFKEFLAKSVFHCHILQNLRIKTRDEPFPPSVVAAPMQPRRRPLLRMPLPLRHRM